MYILHTFKKVRHVDQTMREIVLHIFTHKDIEANSIGDCLLDVAYV